MRKDSAKSPFMQYVNIYKDMVFFDFGSFISLLI